MYVQLVSACVFMYMCVYISVCVCVGEECMYVVVVTYFGRFASLDESRSTVGTLVKSLSRA